MKNNLATIAAALVSIAASLMAVTKYVHYAPLAAALLLGLFCAMLMLPTISRWSAARSAWVLWSILAVFFLEALLVYPRADARKATLGGSDQDDAIILAVHQASHLHYPYAEKTYLGGPISDGPGWLLLNAPAVWAHLYAFQGPLLIAVLAIFIRRKSAKAAFIFAGILVLTPAVHLLLSEGSDLVALSSALSLIALGVYSTGIRAWLWTILFGLIATARLDLLVLPAGVLCARRDWRTPKAWMQTIAATAIAAAFHLVFYFYSPAIYSPLHLAGKAHLFLQHAPFAMPTCLLALAVLAWQFRAKTGAQMLAYMGTVLLLAHLPVAIGNLAFVNFHLDRWEGSEYISLCVVSIAGVAALLTVKQASSYK